MFTGVGRKHVFAIGTAIDEAVIESASKAGKVEGTGVDQGTRVVAGVGLRGDLENVERTMGDIGKDDELCIKEGESVVCSKGELRSLFS